MVSREDASMLRESTTTGTQPHANDKFASGAVRRHGLVSPEPSVSPSPSRGSGRQLRYLLQTMRPEDIEHIWIITGPAGCGKSTVARYLAGQLSLPYIEGDDFHPPSNKQKMSAGIPLNDADRWDWLITLREKAVQELSTPSSAVTAHSHNESGQVPTEARPRGVIVTCSALKHKYRDVIRVTTYTHPHIQVHFIYLKASEAVLQKRVAARQGHYMKSGMVHSQFLNLEEPDNDEEGDVLAVDVDNEPEMVQKRALEVVKAKLKEYPELLHNGASSTDDAA